MRKNDVKKSDIWTTDKTSSAPKRKIGGKKTYALGTLIFDICLDIVSPKMSLFGLISAAGDRIPELVLVPQPNRVLKDNETPTVGLSDHVND